MSIFNRLIQGQGLRVSVPTATWKESNWVLETQMTSPLHEENKILKPEDSLSPVKPDFTH
jgi:hypothetical protein